MLRSTITPNRTRVQPNPNMKHDTIRRIPPTLSTSAADVVARLHAPKTTSNASGVRLFKD